MGDLLPVGLFKAIADPTRVALLTSLAVGGNQTVSQVASCCAVDLSVVSRHLKILERAGVLESEKHGKTVEYRVRVDHLVGLLRRLANALESCCPAGSPTLTDGANQ